MIDMIDFLAGFFQSIADFFSRIWDFLVFIWDEITQFFLMLKPVVSFFTGLLSNIHPLFFVFGVATLVVLLLYVIIGRNAGGD